MRTATILAFAVLAPLAGLAAQTTAKVVPSIYADAEGNSRHAAVFGRDFSGLQVIVDAKELTNRASAAITAIAFRADGDPRNSFSAYSKKYVVTAYNVTTSVSSFGVDPKANIGQAQGTKVFDGTLNVPAYTPPAVLPAGFSIRIPFSPPLLYDATKGNFLFQLDTNDTTTPPSWTIDAAFLRFTAEGPTTAVQDECKNASGNDLDITLGRTTAVVGGNLDINLRSGAVGNFPRTFTFVGVDARAPGLPFKLDGFGMTGCVLGLVPIATFRVDETAGGYAPIQLPLPNTQNVVGAHVYVQSLGLASTTSLAGAVTSDTWQQTIGPATGWPLTARSIFATTRGWFISPSGAYLPVVRIEGVF